VRGAYGRLRDAGRHGAVTRPPAVTASLSTSLTTAQGTWAIAVMGGSAASHNNFWQLFVRRANTAAGRWSPRRAWPITAGW
jgi:hypothetical protein